jgi:hypothetical protein
MQQIHEDIVSGIHWMTRDIVRTDVDLDDQMRRRLVRFNDMLTEYTQCRAYQTEAKAKEFYDYLNDTFGAEFTESMLPLLVRLLPERGKRKCLWKLCEKHGGFGAPRQAQIDAWRRQAKARKEEAEHEEEQRTWDCIACGKRGRTDEACDVCSTTRGRSHELSMKQEKARRAKAEQLEQEQAEAARKEEAAAQQQQQEGRVVFRRVRGAIGDVDAAADYTVAFEKFSTVAAPTAKASVGSKIFYEFEVLKIGSNSCPQAGFASDRFNLTIEGHSNSGVGDDTYRCIHTSSSHECTTLSPFDVPFFTQLGHRRSSCNTMAWW